MAVAITEGPETRAKVTATEVDTVEVVCGAEASTKTSFNKNQRLLPHLL